MNERLFLTNTDHLEYGLGFSQRFLNGILTFWFTLRYCARLSLFEVIARLSDLSHEYFPVGIFCDHLFILLLLGIYKIMDFTAVINRPVV